MIQDLVLPPVGQITEDDHAAACQILAGLAREATDGRGEWVEEADRNLNIVTYGADPPPARNVIVTTNIANAVAAITDKQTADKPRPRIEPVERGEPAESFWAGPQDVGLGMFGLDPNQVASWLDPASGQVNPPVPIDPGRADMIRQALEAGAALGPPDPATGIPGQIPLKDDWLVDVNDELVADEYQGVLDLYWRRSEMDRRVRSNLYQTNILGWTLWLYDFDRDRQRFLLRPTSLREMYIDPTVEDIADAAYAGAEVVIDAALAVRMYPDFAEIIESRATTGKPAGVDVNTQYGDANDRTFERPVVSMRIMWLRDQRCPLSEDDALAAGLVVQSGDEQVNGDAGGDSGVPRDPRGEEGEGLAGVAGNEGSGEVVDAEPFGEPGSYPGAEGSASEDLTGTPSILPQSYILAETGQPVTPTDDEWPSYPCIRQVTQIAEGIVDDRPCEFWDIPIVHNVNRLLPMQPFGIGEPFVLSRIQDAKSRVLRAMVENAEYYRAPVSAISDSMAQAMADGGESAHIFPGKTYKIPDELYAQTGGKVMNVVDPPAMPPTLGTLLPILDQELDDGTGYSKLMQGQAEPGVNSGVQQEQLLSQASSLVAFKSQRTQDFMERLGRLCLHTLVHDLDIEQLGKVVSKYPKHILAAIQKRAVDKMDWDVKVTIATGNGAQQQNEKAAAGQDLQLGAISMETYQEKAGIDPRQEKERMKSQAQEMMAAQAGMGPQQPGAGPAGQGPPQKKPAAP